MNADTVHVLTALVGVLIGWALGRITKQIEFRFNLLQKLAENYQRMKRAALEYTWAMELGQGSTRIDPSKGLGDLRAQVQLCIGDTLSFTYLVAAAFEDAVDPWKAMVSYFAQVSIVDDAKAARAARDLAFENWNTFAKAAVSKLGFWPWGSWRKRAVQVLTAGKEIIEPPTRREEA